MFLYLLLCVYVYIFFSYYFLFYKTQSTSFQLNINDHTYILFVILFFFSVQTVLITQNCADKSINGKVRDLFLHGYLIRQNSLWHKIKGKLQKNYPESAVCLEHGNFIPGFLHSLYSIFLNKNRPKGHLTSNIS